MPTIVLETQINAPAETCFDLIRDPRIHTEATAETDKTPAPAGAAAWIGLGQTVTFEGSHLGMRQRLAFKVVEFDWPHSFVDEMTEGNFKSFKHIHEFLPADGGTLLRDTVTWTSPFGVVGRIIDKVVLENHLRNLIQTRNARLKEIAEAHERIWPKCSITRT